jgi:hypothetical protein
MLHKLFTFAALGMITLTSLAASGCASDNGSAQRPYGLTGTSDDNSHNPRYIDSKGHYRSDWVGDNSH